MNTLISLHLSVIYSVWLLQAIEVGSGHFVLTNGFCVQTIRQEERSDNLFHCFRLCLSDLKNCTAITYTGFVCQISDAPNIHSCQSDSVATLVRRESVPVVTDEPVEPQSSSEPEISKRVFG